MKILVAVPCMDMIHTQFAHSLISLQLICECEISFGASSLIYDIRNKFAEKAVNGGFDRVLWFDSDMTFMPDTMKRLSAHIDNGLDMVTGVYVTRKRPIKPTLYKAIAPGSAEAYSDYPRDSLFEIAGCGFGGVMVTTELIKRVGDVFGYPFSPMLGLGEDLSFCARARQLGRKIYCDSTIKYGHVGMYEYTELDLVRNETNG